MMNSFQRVHNMIEGRPVDRIPVTPILMQFAAKYIRQPYGLYATDYRVLVEGFLRCQEEFQFDQVSVISDPFSEAADLGANVMFPEDDVPLCKDPLIKTYSDAKKIRRVSPHEGRRMCNRVRGVGLFKEKVGAELSICGWVEGPLAEFVDLRGMSDAMMDFHDAPDFFDDMAEILVDIAADFATAQHQAGADVIGVGDAAASLISAEAYTTKVLPWEQELFRRIHAAGAKVKLHICGNITHILDRIALTGADVVDIDWMVDLKLARERLGRDATLCGNFDPCGVLLMQTPEAVRKASLKCQEEAGGKFILMPGCEVPKDTPIANFRALCDATRVG